MAYERRIGVAQLRTRLGELSAELEANRERDAGAAARGEAIRRKFESNSAMTGPLMSKMGWRAANAATSSAAELDRPRGGEERFADSIEEELAYCAQALDSIFQGRVYGGPAAPDTATCAELLDMVIELAVRARVEVAYGQVEVQSPGNSDPLDLSALYEEVREYVQGVVERGLLRGASVLPMRK